MEELILKQSVNEGQREQSNDSLYYTGQTRLRKPRAVFPTSCPGPSPCQTLVITVQNYLQTPPSLSLSPHSPAHNPGSLYAKEKKPKEAKKKEAERDEKTKPGCYAFQRLFQWSVSRFNLFLIRHSPHIFQTPQCYQIQLHGQLLCCLARSILQLHSPRTPFSTVHSLHTNCFVINLRSNGRPR